jgi:hypothetical protein
MEDITSDSGVKFETAVSENQNSITLSKDDFQTILNVIVVVSKRGGFLLEEYKVVGELFDRLKVISN